MSFRILKSIHFKPTDALNTYGKVIFSVVSDNDINYKYNGKLFNNILLDFSEELYKTEEEAKSAFEIDDEYQKFPEMSTGVTEEWIYELVCELINSTTTDDEIECFIEDSNLQCIEECEMQINFEFVRKMCLDKRQEMIDENE